MKRSSNTPSSSHRHETRQATGIAVSSSASASATPATQQAALPSLPLSQLIFSLRDKTIIVKDEGQKGNEREGRHTIESQQVSRRHRLLEQLKIARRVRAVMEQAADQAEKSTSEESKDIIQEKKEVINELVALTQANRGNYTLDSYHIYTDIYKRRERSFKRQFRKAKTIVRNHLKELAKESDPDFVEIEEEEKEITTSESEVEIEIQMEEESEDVAEESGEVAENTAMVNESSENDEDEIVGNITLNNMRNLEEEEESSNPISPKVSDEADESYVDEDDNEHDDTEDTYEPSPSPPQRSSRIFPQKATSRKARRANKSLSRSTSTSSKKSKKTFASYGTKDVVVKGPPIKKKRILKSGRQVSPTIRSTMYEEEKRKNARKRRHKKIDDGIKPKSSSSIASVASTDTGTEEATEMTQDTATSSVSNSVNSTTNTKSNKTKHTKPAPMRKCHLCKKTSSNYHRCHFFFVNGNKCGKVFCHTCLTEKFEYSQEKYDDCIGDQEWHCPSCLGKCNCVTCVRNRAWSERQTSTLSRRSKTRSSVESAYIY